MPDNEDRAHELDTCLLKNLSNPYINRCYLLTESDLKQHLVRRFANFVEKLSVVNIGRRLSYETSFAFANEHLAGSICILCNADICYDGTISKVHSIDMTDRVFALLRYNLRAGATARLYRIPKSTLGRIDSQDTWIFQSPVKVDMKQADFELGRGGCDNRIARVLVDSGLKVSNPLS